MPIQDSERDIFGYELLLNAIISRHLRGGMVAEDSEVYWGIGKTSKVSGRWHIHMEEKRLLRAHTIDLYDLDACCRRIWI